MKTVDGIKIFNGTPHPINFGVGEDVVVVDPDEVISATSLEQTLFETDKVQYVKTVFRGNQKGLEIIERAREAGADVIVGSVIAAQAYPGLVAAMVPLPGFERVPPDQKRMNPYKFTLFEE